jgi:phospholipase/lecithinase/hemolysin
MNGSVVEHVVPVQVPRLAGTRAAADLLVEPIASELRDAVVRVFGQNLIDSSPSFSDQLLQRLVSAGAQSIVVFSSPDDFFGQLQASAEASKFRQLRRATDDEEYSV